METKQLEPLVRTVLRQSPISALRTIDVSVSEDALVLSGRVGSYYYKQMAQHAASAVAVGRDIINQIEVERA